MTRREADGNDNGPRERAVSRPVITPQEEDNGHQHITVRLAMAAADAGERRRSALVGVQYAKARHEGALVRLEADRRRYADSIVAARDQGATVAQIAQQAGVSRNAIYELFRRIGKKARR